MVLSHRNHGNFSKKLTCFLNPNKKRESKMSGFFRKIITLRKERTCFLFSRSLRFSCGVPIAFLLQKKSISEHRVNLKTVRILFTGSERYVYSLHPSFRRLATSRVNKRYFLRGKGREKGAVSTFLCNFAPCQRFVLTFFQLICS